MADATINIAIKTDPAQPLTLLIKQSKEAEKAVDGLSGSFGKVAAALGSLAALKGTFSFVLDSTRQMEDLTTQFIAFTGSTKGAQLQLEKLQAFAATSPFELTELADANRTLLAFGSSSKQSLEQLRQLGEVAAATGKPIGELATIFGQIQAEGKLTGERFNQLIERGVNIGPEIAKSLGVASTSIRGLISDGAITADAVASAFEKMTSAGGQFFGATERLGKTVSGQLSTLKDAFTALGAEIGGRQKGIFSDWISVVTEGVNALTAYSAAQRELEQGGQKSKRVAELKDQLEELRGTLNDVEEDIKRNNAGGFSTIRLNIERTEILQKYKELNKELVSLSVERNNEIAAEQKKADDAEQKAIDQKKADAAAGKLAEQQKIEQAERDKAIETEVKKVEEKEKRITEIAFQEAAVRNAILKEQQGANDAEKVTALQEREAVLTSERLKIESDRLILLKEFESSELLQRQDTLNKKIAAEKKAETDRLAISKKAQAEQFNLEIATQNAQKKFDEQTYAHRVTTAQTGLAALSSLMKSRNREAFEIGKAASIAQALVAIPVSAIEAYKSLAGIPVVGVGLGIAAAAAATAAGLENVRAIQATKLPAFAEGGMVPGVGNKDTVPALLTPGEVIVPKKNFADLEASFVQGAIANDQVILMRQSNDIQARILESVTFGAVIEKLTTIIAKLDQIGSMQSSSIPSFDTKTIEPIITEIAQNSPQSQGGFNPASIGPGGRSQ